MTTLFISYKHEDTAQVREFVDVLKQKYCFMAWIDVDNLLPGYDWKADIKVAIDEADAVLVMLSPQAIQSNQVIEEVAYALEREKRIIPVMLQPVTVEDLRLLGVSHLQYYDYKLENPSKVLKPLIKSLPVDRTNRRLNIIERERFVDFVIGWLDKCRLTPHEIVSLIENFHCKELKVSDFENLFLRKGRTPLIPITLLVALAHVFRTNSANFPDPADQFTRVEALELANLAGLDDSYWNTKIRKIFPPKWLWKIDSNDTVSCYERETLVSDLYHQATKKAGMSWIIVGIEGIGKTTIARELAIKAVNQSDFDYIGGFSLKNLAEASSLIDEIGQFISNKREHDPSVNINQQFHLLLKYLRQERCLIILDNFETVLSSSEPGGYDKYSEYHRLIEIVLKGTHKSSFVITSRKMPDQLKNVSTIISPDGLSVNGIRKILSERGLTASDDILAELKEKALGNPQLIRLFVQNCIPKDIGQDITEYFRLNGIHVPRLPEMIDEIIQSLSPLQKDIVYWLMIIREPVAVAELANNLVEHVILSGMLQKNCDLLCERGLLQVSVHKDRKQYSLQNAILECLSESFTNKISLEINDEKPQLLRSHALLQATSKGYIRDAQYDHIIRPILNSFQNVLSPQALDRKLMRILDQQSDEERINPNYIAGNIINLLNFLKRPLHNRDFSHTSIRQAYLRDVELHNVDFRCSDLQDCTFSEMFASVLAISISPDGKYLAACTNKGETRLWDLTELKHVKSFWGHPVWTHYAIFTPDLHKIITAEGTGHIKLWNIETETCEIEFRAHEQRIYHLAVSPDGTLLASCGDDGTVKLWDTADYHNVYIFPREESYKWVRGISFSPDGKYIASASENNLKIWDLSNKTCVQQINSTDLWTVAFSPDGRWLAFSGESSFIEVWDTENWKFVWKSRPEDSHENTIWTIVFSPDGLSIATSSADQSIKVWDAITGICKQTISGQTKSFQQLTTLQPYSTRHRRWVRALSYSPNGELLISGSDDGLICIRDASTGHTINTLLGRTDGIRCISLSPDGNLLAASSEQERVELWNLTTEEYTLWGGYTGWIRSITFSPDGHHAATTDVDKVYLHDVSTGRVKHVFHHESEAWVWSIAFSPDGRWLAATGEATREKDIFLWDVFTHKEERIPNAFDRWRWRVIFSPDGKYLVATGEEGAIRFWDFQTKELCIELKKHSKQAWGIAFSSDMTRFASTGYDNQVHLWDFSRHNHPQLINSMLHKDISEAIAFTPDCRLLVSASYDGMFQVWDAKQGDALSYPIHAHDAPIYSIACSRDNLHIITASGDGYIRFWDTTNYQLKKELKTKQFYSGMNVSCVTGLSNAQLGSLLKLGALHHENC